MVAVLIFSYGALVFTAVLFWLIYEIYYRDAGSDTAIFCAFVGVTIFCCLLLAGMAARAMT